MTALGLGLSLPFLAGRGGGLGTAWVLRGDGDAPALYQADYNSNRYWRDGDTIDRDGTFARNSDAWHLVNGVYTAVGPNVIRISNKGLLIERQVANQASAVSGSGMFTANTNATRTDGSVGLDGVTASASVTSTSASGYSQRALSIAADTARRWVGFAVKKTSFFQPSTCQIVMQGGTSVNQNVVVDTWTGVITAGAGIVEDAGTHWILWVSVVCNNNTTWNARFIPAQGLMGTAEAWGLQMITSTAEPTSFVLTGGYTRLKEEYSHALAALTVGSPQSFVVQWGKSALPASGARGYLLCISDGTANNRVAAFLDSNGYVNLEIIAGGVQQALITGTVRKTKGGRLAFAYAANDAVLYVDGEQIGTDASVVVPTGLTTLHHGSDQAGASQIDGYVVSEAALAGRQSNTTLATLSYLAPAEPFADELAQWFNGGVSGKKVVFSGDSTTQVATEMFNAITSTYVTPSDGPLNGVTMLNLGQSGATIQNFLATTDIGYDIEYVIAENAALYVLCWGINDIRQGARTSSQLTADLITAVDQLRAAVPGADILLWGPNPFLTTDVDAKGLVVPNSSAQAYSTALYNAYSPLVGMWPNVAVVQKQDEVYGQTPLASSDLMADQIHPGANGRRFDAVSIVKYIGLQRP